ncbi:MAG TPA: efflux RND transporter periplasmic adaptor subunit [bacterium]|nr:efflux RND transporter periplasmic adaptor subunit [bacterium]
MRTQAILILVLLLSACGGKPPEPPAATNGKGGGATVALAAAAIEKRERVVDITGSLLPWREATVAIEADGRVVALGADLGSAVKSGAVIARLASEDYEFKVRQAEVEFKAAEADLARISALADKSMATRQQADDAARRVDVARVTLDTAKKKLADTELKAPFDAVVAKRLVNEGEYLRTGSTIFHLAQVSPLKFRGEVPERYAPLVKSGIPVTVTPASAPGTTAKGTIRRVGPLIAADNRSFPIEAEVPNVDLKIKSGTFAACRILLPGSEEVVAIPEKALVTFAGTDKVFVFENGKIKERLVTVADRRAGKVLLAQGLSAGEQVVVSASESLYDGMVAAPRAE